MTEIPAAFPPSELKRQIDEYRRCHRINRNQTDDFLLVEIAFLNHDTIEDHTG